MGIFPLSEAQQKRLAEPNIDSLLVHLPDGDQLVLDRRVFDPAVPLNLLDAPLVLTPQGRYRRLYSHYRYYHAGILDAQTSPGPEPEPTDEEDKEDDEEIGERISPEKNRRSYRVGDVVIEDRTGLAGIVTGVAGYHYRVYWFPTGDQTYTSFGLSLAPRYRALPDFNPQPDEED